MVENAQNKLQERTKLFEDLYSGIIPKRVPINTSLPIEFIIQYAGLPLAETQWSLDGIEDAMDKAFAMTSSDYFPASYPRYPAHLQILGSKGLVMGSNGFIQHPEVSVMRGDEYDEFIEDPHTFMYEKVAPRLYSELDTDPVSRSIVMAKAFKAYFDYTEAYGKINAKLKEKYGFYTAPAGSMSGVTVPFDALSDFLRGFKGITMDVKRNPQKVIEACEAILPHQIKKGISPKPSRFGHAFIALHMGPFLRTKDFEKLFWPTFYKLVHTMAKAGQPSLIFCEADWMRYLDYLVELPAGTRFFFEYGDPKLAKEKLGKKHILSGFYPITYTKTATKEQCIDKAKELIDILAPGGNYYFNFDKSPYTLDTVNVENYAAVLKYVAENTNYANAGQPVTTEKFIEPTIEEIPKFESKFYTPWDEYKIKNNISPNLESVMAPKIQGYEEMFFAMMGMMM